MDLLKKIFIFTLFLFPLGEVFRLDFGNGVIIKPIDVGVVFVVLLWLIIKNSHKQKIKQRYILIPVLLFFLTGLFSLLVGGSHLSLNEFLISFSYLFRWIVYAGIFFVIFDLDNNFKKTISKALIICGSLIVGLGYVQYFYYSNLRNLFYLGWDEHMYRMFSVFLDPNYAGSFFVLFFLFLICLFLKKKTFLIGLILTLTLGAIFLTFSRSSLIMLVAGSSILFALMNKKMLIVMLLGIIFIFICMASAYFNIENVNLFRAVSSEARLETAGNALLIIKNNPLIGVGFNSYRYAQFRYGLRNRANAQSHADSAPDNSFLFVIATTGIVGFILYLFLWVRVFKISSVLAIASITGVFINSMFINSLFYPFIMLWLWIIIAIKENN